MPALDHVLQFLGGGDSSRAATAQASSDRGRPDEARESSPFTRLLGQQQNRAAAREQEGPPRMLPQPGKATDKGADSGPLPTWPLSENGSGGGEAADPELTATFKEKPAKPGGMLLPPEGEALPQAIREDADRGESGGEQGSGSPASEAFPLSHASLRVLSAAADGQGRPHSSVAGAQSPADPTKPGMVESGELRQAPGPAGATASELAGRNTGVFETGSAMNERTRAQDPTQARAEDRIQNLTQAQNSTGQQSVTAKDGSGATDGTGRRTGDGRESLARRPDGGFASFQPGTGGSGNKGATDSSMSRGSQEPSTVAAMEATRPDRVSPRAESLSVRDITGNREVSLVNPTGGERELRQHPGNLWRGNEMGLRYDDNPGWRQTAVAQGNNDVSRMVEMQNPAQQSGRLQQFIEQWQAQQPGHSASSSTGGESDKGLNPSARPTDSNGTTLPPAPNRGDGGVSPTGSATTPVSGDSSARAASDGLSGAMERLFTQSGGKEQWSESISQRVALMTGQRLGSAELQLDPPELGRLTIQIQVSGDQATVNFVSPNATVRDSLEQSVSRLQELMAEQGLDLADVDVSDQSDSDQEQPGQTATADAGGEAEEEAASVEKRRQLSISLVDDYA